MNFHEKSTEYLKLGVCYLKPVLNAQEISTLRQRLDDEFQKKLNPTQLNCNQIDDNVATDLILKAIFHADTITMLQILSSNISGDPDNISILPIF